MSPSNYAAPRTENNANETPYQSMYFVFAMGTDAELTAGMKASHLWKPSCMKEQSN